MKNKTYDAVKLMREIRDNLSQKYMTDPQSEQTDLTKIQKKYNIPIENQIDERITV